MSDGVVLRGIACGRYPAGLPTVGRLRGLVGRFDRVVADASGDERLVGSASTGLPAGAALPEATAVRLRREGARLSWGEPVVVQSPGELLAFCAERGRSSVDVVRADPSLLTELQLGSWFDATWTVRLLRRLTTRAPLPARAELRLAADAAFWRGVRSRATAAEWTLWTRSSYVALVYHRLAGEQKDGQETVDLAPEMFARQLRALRLLRFRQLGLDELLALHETEDPARMSRAYAVTFDDGFLDCLAPLLEPSKPEIQLFVPTAEIGGRAHWLADEPLLGWDDVRTLAQAGVVIGSHARHHRPLVGLAPADLADELEGSRPELAREIASPSPVVAYPHGAHDEKVRAAAMKAGFRAAFTTAKGRNGHGTDRFGLRRVSVHEADGVLAVLWKVSTGEGLPKVWLRLRRLRKGTARVWGAGRSGGGAV